MNKQEFLERLRRGLRGLPQGDIEERLNFYAEMIDDRMEEGLSEAEAVAEIGGVDEVVSQILAETPLTKLVKEKIKPKSPVNPGVVVLLILGFPLWFPILAAVFAIVLAAYIVVWSVIISLWAVFVSLIASWFGVIFSAVYNAVCGRPLTALALLAIALVSAGAAILMFFICLAAARGVIWATKKIAIGLKHMLVGKETAR